MVSSIMRAFVLATALTLGLFTSAVAMAANRPTVMVLYFDNNASSPAYDGLAKGLADMMMTDLAAVPSIQVLEREKLDALLAELKLQQSKYFDAKTAVRLGKGIGAQYAVTGAFVSIEPTIRIDVRLIRVDSAAVVKAASVTGHKDDFFKLQEQLAARLTEGISEIVGAADAQKIGDSARANRVGKLNSVLDYGKGLDARDRGDLDAASKHLQKVVTSEPKFALGKSRYSEIMKALYKAKDRREGMLSNSEKELLAHADAVFAKYPPTDPHYVAFRVVRGQCYLERVHKAVEAGQPVSAWRGDLRTYFQNQDKLIAETKDLPEYSRSRLGKFSPEDEKLAEDIGIMQPGSTFFLSSPAEMMRESAKVIMMASVSNFYAHLDPDDERKMPCPFTLDPAYGAAAIRWFETALTHIAKHDHRYAERETMRTLQELAKSLALLGRTEEAIARLQGGLEAYPKSGEFKYVEDLLRELLEGPPHLRCKAK
jgi:TolB-like protein